LETTKIFSCSDSSLARSQWKKKNLFLKLHFSLDFFFIIYMFMSSNNYYTSFFLLYISVKSISASFLSLLLLIYHCRKQAVVTIEYLLSYLTTSSSKRERERLTSLLTFITLFVPFTFTAKRIWCLQRGKLVAQLESSFVCHRM
jgi:ABC-type Fe3+-siderophore transport system permease subunit